LSILPIRAWQAPVPLGSAEVFIAIVVMYSVSGEPKVFLREHAPCAADAAVLRLPAEQDVTHESFYLRFNGVVLVVTVELPACRSNFCQVAVAGVNAIANTPDNSCSLRSGADAGLSINCLCNDLDGGRIDVCGRFLCRLDVVSYAYRFSLRRSRGFQAGFRAASGMNGQREGHKNSQDKDQRYLP
jgi:hypothetical protein